jgi:hypothetical protein
VRTCSRVSRAPLCSWLLRRRKRVLLRRLNRVALRARVRSARGNAASRVRSSVAPSPACITAIVSKVLMRAVVQPVSISMGTNDHAKSARCTSCGMQPDHPIQLHRNRRPVVDQLRRNELTAHTSTAAGTARARIPGTLRLLSNSSHAQATKPPVAICAGLPLTHLAVVASGSPQVTVLAF